MELLQLNAYNDNQNNKLDDYDLEEYISADFLDMPAIPASPSTASTAAAAASAANNGTMTGELDRFLASLYAASYRSCATSASDNASTGERAVKRGRPRKDSDPQPATSTVSAAPASDQSRRERNRLAAQRCRERRLARMEELEEEIDKLKREKEEMMAELIRLGARQLS